MTARPGACPQLTQPRSRDSVALPQGLELAAVRADTFLPER